MDKEILEILKSIQENINDLKQGQERIEKKLDGVVEQTANLVEFRTEITNKVDEIREDLSTVELVTAKNYKDIVHLKSVK